MGQKKYMVEQIVVKMREIELLCNKGNTIAEVARQALLIRPTTAGVKSTAA